MRRLNLALLATLQLCYARVPGRSFNVHEDLLAFPQFEIVFKDQFISEKEAQALLDSNLAHRTPSPSGTDVAKATDDAHPDESPASGAEVAQTSYELINMAPHRYLCSIPVIQPPPLQNDTANELAKAEEARELGRAAASGWQLMSHLEDTCLYFMSGWWSYSFCKNREIVQFHALPTINSGQPPKRDPQTADYVLGRVPSLPRNAEHQARRDDDSAKPFPAELQTKGDQRYLVQRLEGGTICDLTGRERTIEVQYHCMPGQPHDRIGWIKEVTICAYLMVINTPHLCNDVAFLPPKETKANPIDCRLIVNEGESNPPLLDQSREPVKDIKGQAEKQDEGWVEDDLAPEFDGITIGDVVVGARKVISGADEAGKPPVKLAPPKSYFPQQKSPEERLIELIAQAASKADGGRVEKISPEKLEELELEPELIEEMQEKMQEIAGDQGWKLEIVELPGGDMRELRGYVDGDDEEEGDKGEGEGEGEGSQEKFFKKEEL